MTVVIAKQYEKDLRVDGSMKSRAWDFMMKLNADPDGGGLDVKLPQGNVFTPLAFALLTTSVAIAVAVWPEYML